MKILKRNLLEKRQKCLSLGLNILNFSTLFRKILLEKRKRRCTLPPPPLWVGRYFVLDVMDPPLRCVHRHRKSRILTSVIFAKTIVCENQVRTERVVSTADCDHSDGLCALNSHSWQDKNVDELRI